MRRWFLSLLLACLLVSQQGLLLHGLGHALASVGAARATADAALSGGPPLARDDAAGAEAQRNGHNPAADDVCGTCLAFVQLAGAVGAGLTPPGLLAGLSYALAAPAPVALGSAPLPTPRSRGPPAAT